MISHGRSYSSFNYYQYARPLNRMLLPMYALVGVDFYQSQKEIIARSQGLSLMGYHEIQLRQVPLHASEELMELCCELIRACAHFIIAKASEIKPVRVDSANQVTTYLLPLAPDYNLPAYLTPSYSALGGQVLQMYFADIEPYLNIGYADDEYDF